MTDDVIAYARSFLGVMYHYGGNNRLQGFDCGSFVAEVLRSFGLVGPHEDLSAQMLFDRFGRIRIANPEPTALLFFGESTFRITHVAMALNSWRMIEAGGGDRTTDNPHAAAQHGAMVRERPIRNRKDLIAVALPPWISPVDPEPK